MEIDRVVNREYQEVISICRFLKPHATNALLLENGLVAMQPIIPEIANYAILREPDCYPRFKRMYINLGEIASINTKFKKTLSSIQWKAKDGIATVEIENVDMEPYNVYVFTERYMVDSVLDSAYGRVPGWNEVRQGILIDEPDDMYVSCEGLAADLYAKKMCRIVANGNQIMVSKPFLGDTKSTELILYRVIHEDPEENGKIVLKFKQKEKLGNIYTYACFLKIPA